MLLLKRLVVAVLSSLHKTVYGEKKQEVVPAQASTQLFFQKPPTLFVRVPNDSIPRVIFGGPLTPEEEKCIAEMDRTIN